RGGTPRAGTPGPALGGDMQIVVGTDFSESSAHAGGGGIELVRRKGGKRHPGYSVYVPPQVQVGAKWGGGVHAAAREGARARVRASELLGRIEAQGVAVELYLVDDHPVAAILDCAERVNADWIATGARGPLHFVTLGSVAERVARFAKCPVLTCAPTRAAP